MPKYKPRYFGKEYFGLDGSWDISHWKAHFKAVNYYGHLSADLLGSAQQILAKKRKLGQGYKMFVTTVVRKILFFNAALPFSRSPTLCDKKRVCSRDQTGADVKHFLVVTGSSTIRARAKDPCAARQLVVRIFCSARPYPMGPCLSPVHSRRSLSRRPQKNTACDATSNEIKLKYDKFLI